MVRIHVNDYSNNKNRKKKKYGERENIRVVNYKCSSHAVTRD